MKDTARWYAILEIREDASPDEIRRAYRELAQVWHPDRFGDKPALQQRAASKLKEITEAYRELVRAGALGGPGSLTDEARAGGRAPSPQAETRAPTADPDSPRRELAAGIPAWVMRKDLIGVPLLLLLTLDERVRPFAAALAATWTLVVLALAPRRPLPTAARGALLSLSLLVLAASGMVALDGTPRFTTATGGAVPVTAIGAGPQQACALAGDQGVYCWGAGYLDEESPDRRCRGLEGEAIGCTSRPRQVLAEPAVAVSQGLESACAVVEDGSVWCWGAGFAGQLASGGTADGGLPARVPGDVRLTSITSLGQHACGLASEGRLYCWGSNVDGQIGRPGGATCRAGAARFPCVTTPAQIAPGEQWTAVSAGGSHTCALNRAGVAFCWGSNREGQLGTPTGRTCSDPEGEYACSRVPLAVAGGLRFRTLAAGAAHTCALTRSGKAYCWGLNAFGQLGDGTTENRASPEPVHGGIVFESIAAGGVHSCGIATDGALHCWGRNEYGELRAGSSDRCEGVLCSREPVRHPERRTFQAVWLGGGFTCAMAEGTTSCWGRNDMGQLGDGRGLAFFATADSQTDFGQRLRREAGDIRWRFLRLLTSLDNLIVRIVRELEAVL